MDFTHFAPTGQGWNDGEWAQPGKPVALPDLDAIIAQIQQLYGPNAIAPEIFTEGGEGDLQNLQNVGNAGGWGTVTRIK